jgi:hypothetical protein
MHVLMPADDNRIEEKRWSASSSQYHSLDRGIDAQGIQPSLSAETGIAMRFSCKRETGPFECFD